MVILLVVDAAASLIISFLLLLFSLSLVFEWLGPRKLKFNHRETIHGRRMHIKINHKILLTVSVCARARAGCDVI